MSADSLPTYPDFSRIPARAAIPLRVLHGFQEAYFIARQVAALQNILIVGETSGRDSLYLQSLGKRTVAVDIEVHRDIPNLLVADANHTWPFPTGSFDAVVMSEVIEHLFNDTGALAEARRVLKADGRLVVTVPFGDDAPFHARLHSARTIQTLIQVSGFKIESFYERGGLLGAADLIEKAMAVVYRLRRLFNPALGQLECYYPWLVVLTDWNLARRPSPHGLFAKYHGGYVMATKGPYMNFNQIQREWFEVGGKCR